ncbi:Esc2p KNAG_0C04980 [Huiozyma naganishii CBS 8797]|uniref:Rad60/SUMO-like domain-containing protein n=1 Tax=Huiozyma naganishii (strain ATCC MYA-139 / BCRC 22969 / CBS 8797 / KCTC 17520 / NBRC 10181 / NCYC 3082 / Yp74L-3) TaxID=1071383 RepID=J7S510_HUIN7|nr:hypothetical protein KNAG_0C04980 [Kazachstania naganishii CBS 8797]CCK69599.1 hypothetical protein KNAG_0C04980 [Kazachstania naganishii CBS 8797]
MVSSDSDDDFFNMAGSDAGEPVLAVAPVAPVVPKKTATETVPLELESSSSESSRRSSRRGSDRSVSTESGSDESPRRKRRKMGTDSSSSSSSDAESGPDDEEQFFQELLRARTQSVEPAETATTSTVPSPVYRVRFQSQLEGTLGKSVQVKVIGTRPLGTVLPSVLSALVRACRVPQVLQGGYTEGAVGMYRGGARVLPFMNCNSLGVVQEFENEVLEVDVVLRALNLETPASDVSGGQEATNGTEAAASVPVPVPAPATAASESPGNPAPALMKIALLSADNRRLYVKVHGGTPCSRLLEYYRMERGLPAGAPLQLRLDDEQVSPETHISELDLEDGDVLEIAE